MFKKKIPNEIYRFKMASKLPIFFLRHFNFGENLKNHFRKFSMKFGS